MNFQADFNALSPGDQKRARQKLRQALGDVLTQVDEFEQSTFFTVQLECVSSQAHKMLNQRVRVNSYGSDCLLLSHKLYLHEVEFVRSTIAPEVGIYHELNFMDSELWRVASVLEKANHGPCQILRTDEAIRRIMDIDQFKPYLPKKLQNLNFTLIEKREKSSPNPSPNSGGGALDTQV